VSFAGTRFALAGLPAGPQHTACCKRETPHLLQLTGVAQQLQIPAKEREKSHSPSFLSLALTYPMTRFGGNEGVLEKEWRKGKAQ